MDTQSKPQDNYYIQKDELSSIFVKRLGVGIIAVSVAILVVLLLIYGVHLWLMLFASIMFAVTLRGIGNLLMYPLPMDNDEIHGVWKVITATLMITVVLAVAFLFLGPRLNEQFNDLSTRLPEGVESLQKSIRTIPAARTILDSLPNPDVITGQLTSSNSLGTNLLGGVTEAVSWVSGFLLESFIIIVVGLYFAINPSVYVENFLRLFPRPRRTRLRSVLDETNLTLRNWLLARLASVIVIIILTVIGLMILDMPLVLTLAIIAGVFSFIPNLGPIIGAIPAIIIAFTISPAMVLAVIMLYTLIQMIESYLITPGIERYTLSLPPALVIMMQLFATLFLGILGVLLAAPLMAAVIVLIKELYVEDILGDSVGKLTDH